MLVTALASLAFAGPVTEDEVAEDVAVEVAPPVAQIIEDARTAVGGKWLDKLKTVGYSVKSEFHDPTQGTEAVAIATATGTITYGFDGDLRIQLDAEQLWPRQQRWYTTTTIADGVRGMRQGLESPGGSSKDVLSGLRIGALTKANLLASPDQLLRSIFADPSVCESHIEDGLWRVSTLWEGAPASLWIDPNTHIPTGITVVEDRPMGADVTVEARWTEWKLVDGARFPMQIEVLEDGVMVQRDVRTNLDVGAELVAEVEAPTADPDELLVGAHRSRWVVGAALRGEPINSMIPVLQAETIGLGVHRVWADGYNVLVVDHGHGLAVIGAPIGPEFTEAMYALVAERWPGLSIRDVILTHPHTDHVAGVRPYIARGVRVFGSVPSIRAAKRAAAAEPLLILDALVGSEVEPQLFAVKTAYAVEGSDQHTVELFAHETSHGEGMVLVWVGHTQTLYTADLFMPGHPLKKADVAYEASRVHARLAELELEPLKIVGVHGEVGDLKDLEKLAKKAL